MIQIEILIHPGAVMILSIFIVSIIGFAISLYTYLLEQKVKENPDYKPACDLSDRVSCTKPMKSSYANLFFISNALVGMIFYSLIAVFAALNMTTLLFIAAIVGMLATFILAYLLYFKIKT